MTTRTELTDVDPPFLFPTYQATVRRAPSQRLVKLPRDWFHTMPGPVFGRIPIGPNDNDLLHQHAGEPLGLRIVLSGRVLDSDGRGVPELAHAPASDSSGRALKIMRPVVVWITFFTRTVTSEPMCGFADSTTTIVPSSR